MTENLAGLAGLRETAQALLDKLKLCKDAEAPIYQCAFIHGVTYKGPTIEAEAFALETALEAAAPPSTAPLNTQKLMNNDRLEEIRAQLYGTDDGITIDDAKWLLHAYEQLINRVATPSPQAPKHELFTWNDLVCKSCGLSIGFWPSQPECKPVPAATQEPAGSGTITVNAITGPNGPFTVPDSLPGHAMAHRGHGPNCSCNDSSNEHGCPIHGEFYASNMGGSPRKVGEDGQRCCESGNFGEPHVCCKAPGNLPTNIADLRERLFKLDRLLCDPHPGLMTWHEAYGKAVANVLLFWDGPSSAPVGEQQ